MKQFLSAVALSLGLSLAVSANAQMSAQDNRAYFDFGEQFYSSISQSPDNTYVDIRLNSASAMLSFVRSTRKRELDQGAYYSVRDLSIEVLEKGKVMPLVSRGVKDTIYVNTFEHTTSKNFWHAHNERVMLPELDSSKEYSVRLEIRDGVLGKLATRPMTVELKPRAFVPTASDSTALSIGDLHLISDVSGDMVRLESRGVTYPFSRNIVGSYLIAVPDSWSLDDLSADIVLRQTYNLITPSDTGERSRVTVSATSLQRNMTYEPHSADSQLVLRLVPAPVGTTPLGGAYRFAILNFTLPGEMLEQGGYKAYLTVRTNGVSRSQSNNINLRWKNMPISLEDPRDAIAPMVHILTERELADLQSGDRAAQFVKLFEYWKRQDPTPGTAYNENMAAFYQRVDYAYFNFATGRILDGAMTDRGKVYILFGPPTNVERQLLPGEQPTEIWTYTNNVKRRFKFTDAGSRGEYKLVEMKNL